jgi:hypothetical protein
MNRGASERGAVNFFVLRVLVTTIAATTFGIALAQTPPAAKDPAGSAVAAKTGVGALNGTWVRPDGGYQIVISGASRDGRLEAMYFNPNPLPFAKAEAAMDGATLHVSLELRAGGYAGSTYELVYDPLQDRLLGVYYQAVAKQRFDVYFVRK